MKDFMLIFINGEGSKDFSPEQMQANMQEWFGWVNDLKNKGIYVGGEALLPAGKTVKGKDAVITDGPFAESKEVVGGYFIVKAADIDEASEIAKASPDLPYGGAVQVREVMKF
ncbi:MAG TPA: YciI family protein [Chitinophagaceae bacterium]|nr:YciI family protein [Chitinophagaceae bacterium]